MPIRSLLPSVYVPPQTLPQFLDERSRDFRHRVGLINGKTGEEFTIQRLLTDSIRIGNGLRAIGVRKGVVVAMFLPTCPEFVTISLGTMRAGGIVSGANPAYKVFELTNFLVESDARIIFTTGWLLPTVTKASEARGKQINAIYVVDNSTSTSVHKPHKDLLKYPPTPVPCEPINPVEDLCTLPFSSGTTGRPKGVMVTHRNFVAALVSLGAGDPAITPTADDCTVEFLPAFHMYGFCILMFVFVTGMRMVTLPKFVPKDFLGVAQRYECTILYLVPPVLLFLSKNSMVKEYDLSKLRVGICGAAPCGSEMISEFRQRFPNVEHILQAYGMTEIPLACAMHCPSFVSPTAGSTGHPMPNVEIKIVDLENGAELPAFQNGEICARGPSAMKGYANRPEETAGMCESDGWLRTGDIGHYDDKKLLYIVDRKKELIKVKGFQVPPAELEDVLLSSPKIADAAVIGIPDARTGEAPRAYIVAKGQLTEAEVHKFVDVERLLRDRANADETLQTKSLCIKGSRAVSSSSKKFPNRHRERSSGDC